MPKPPTSVCSRLTTVPRTPRRCSEDDLDDTLIPSHYLEALGVHRFLAACAKAHEPDGQDLFHGGGTGQRERQQGRSSRPLSRPERRLSRLDAVFQRGAFERLGRAPRVAGVPVISASQRALHRLLHPRMNADTMAKQAKEAQYEISWAPSPCWRKKVQKLPAATHVASVGDQVWDLIPTDEIKRNCRLKEAIPATPRLTTDAPPHRRNQTCVFSHAESWRSNGGAVLLAQLDKGGTRQLSHRGFVDTYHPRPPIASNRYATGGKGLHRPSHETPLSASRNDKPGRDERANRPVHPGKATPGPRCVPFESPMGALINRNLSLLKAASRRASTARRPPRPPLRPFCSGGVRQGDGRAPGHDDYMSRAKQRRRDRLDHTLLDEYMDTTAPPDEYRFPFLSQPPARPHTIPTARLIMKTLANRDPLRQVQRWRGMSHEDTKSWRRGRSR
ncbi:unnamed protein product [Vitrella brassicaformis CCMP3155]|uniref:Uncharacterized protein n=1 Tax=Vitrella brassicaformis (strain CCMP3155) TaxID=1169540 RepID=A0A0G4ENN6_VITBC|nr:unnamed protein product [Vitrella brassicaformis CCMP3155]|eukprot:CEL98599.1 unnamed protein product [Vitrella brassicaformis CCMP3155]